MADGVYSAGDPRPRHAALLGEGRRCAGCAPHPPELTRRRAEARRRTQRPSVERTRCRAS
eukprot:3482271-Rhodomonas_salina.1